MFTFLELIGDIDRVDAAVDVVKEVVKLYKGRKKHIPFDDEDMFGIALSWLNAADLAAREITVAHRILLNKQEYLKALEDILVSRVTVKEIRIIDARCATCEKFGEQFGRLSPMHPMMKIAAAELCAFMGKHLQDEIEPKLAASSR